MSRTLILRCDLDDAPVEEGGASIAIGAGHFVDVCAACLAGKTAGDLARVIEKVRANSQPRERGK